MTWLGAGRGLIWERGFLTLSEGTLQNPQSSQRSTRRFLGGTYCRSLPAGLPAFPCALDRSVRLVPSGWTPLYLAGVPCRDLSLW